MLQGKMVNGRFQHDEDTDICSPGLRGAGNYIMYARATDGNLPNNVKFSTCSKKAITRVLSVKAVQCFQQEKSYCGNKVSFEVIFYFVDHLFPIPNDDEILMLKLNMDNSSATELTLFSRLRSGTKFAIAEMSIRVTRSTTAARPSRACLQAVF